MRVLFLDFDGVLNNRRYVERARWDPPLGSVEDLQILDPVAVALLNLVIESTGAVVVVTSSWRITYQLDVLRSLLERRGFVGEVIGVTPQLPARQRANEIRQWLAEHAGDGIESFAIVDDDWDAGVDHSPHFVKTSFETGLTQVHATELTEILKIRIGSLPR